METSIGNIRMMRMPQVVQTTGLARSTIYKLIAKREFPNPVKLTTKSVAWSSIDIESWIASRARSARA